MLELLQSMFESMGQRSTQQAVALPALLAGAFIALMWRPWRSGKTESSPGRDASRWFERSALPFALGVAFIWSWWSLRGGALPELQPRARWEYLFHLTVALSVLGIGWGVIGARRGAPLVMTGLIALAVAFILQPLPNAGSTWAWRGGIAGSVIVLAGSGDVLARKRPGAFLPMVLFIVAMGVSLLSMQVGSSLRAQFAGLVASICAFTALATIGIHIRSGGRRAISLARGGAAAVIALLAAVLIIDWWYETMSVPWAVFILPMLGVVGQWGLEFGPARRLPVWARYAAGALIAAIPAVIAVQWAIQSEGSGLY